MADHESTDSGLNAWSVGIHQAEVIAEAEARGDFGAEGALTVGLGLSEGTRNQDYIRRGRELIQTAGMLAAREARFHKVEISGWEEPRAT